MKKIMKTAIGIALGMLLAEGALAVGATAEPTCAQVICLSPAPGTPAPQECFPIRAVYFAITVYDPLFDADATAGLRKAFLQTCLTASAPHLMLIDTKYGRLPADPIVY